MTDSTPLLVQFPESASEEGSVLGWKSTYHSCRDRTGRFLSSKAKHWVLLALIVLDVAGILADILIALITCELGREKELWVDPTRAVLKSFSLALSTLFLIELLASLWVDGLRFFRSWFHCMDAFVIVASFCIDLLEHGVGEEIASLIIILRLWRFVKIVDEFSVEASEQMEDYQKRIEELERENADLRARLERSGHQQDEEAAIS